MRSRRRKDISHKHQAGFSLLELSIVIIIIGLLIGAVIGGQAMIRAAEVRTIITETQSYLSAVDAFSAQYYALPGDMVDATATLGASGDGDGDGLLEYTNGTDAEGNLAWEHLEVAEMIAEGGLTGGGGAAIAGTNVPASEIIPLLYYFDTNGISGNFLGLGAAGYTGAADDVGALTGEMAQSLDEKMDNGFANSGRVRGDTLAGCHTAGTYNTGGEATVCALHVRLNGSQ